MKHFLEYLMVLMVFTISRILPLEGAGNMLGWILNCSLPIFKGVNKTIDKNLLNCFPQKNAAQRAKIKKAYLVNTGHQLAEGIHFYYFPHQGNDQKIKIKLYGKPDFSKANIFVSGHYGSYPLLDFLPRIMQFRANIIHRKLKNPFVERFFCRLRENKLVNPIHKGTYAMKAMLNGIQDSESIILLVDQKLREGVEMEFMGSKVKGTALPAKVAKKYDLPIYPIRALKTKEGYVIEVFPQINTEKSVEVITQDISDVIEDWVQEHPHQWFWAHNRWS